MDQALKQELLDAYQAWMPDGPPLDTKMMRYWQTMIHKKERTLDDFKEMLLKHPPFVHRMTSLFKDIFFERVGISEYDASIFDVYRASWTIESVFDRDHVNQWICSTGFFKEKLNDIMTHMRIDSKLFEIVLARFKTHPIYSFERLQKDVPSLIHMAETMSAIEAKASTNLHSSADCDTGYGFGMHTRSDLPTPFAECSIVTDVQCAELMRLLNLSGPAQASFSQDAVSDRVPATGSETDANGGSLLSWNDVYEEICQKLMLLASKGEAADSSGVGSTTTVGLPVASPAEQVRDDGLIHAFEQIMERPMFVHEYLYYIKHQPLDVASIQLQRTLFYEVREVYQKHINKNLDEYNFVKTYLTQLHDTECFMEQFLKDILDSADYRDNMISIINTKYQRMYGETLDREDLQVIFAKIKQKRLHLFSEELSSTIVEFKRETDDIITHIFDKYMSLLDRQPDSYESTQYMHRYRERYEVGFDALDAELEKDLVHSLEYHDVIKQKIKRAYVSNHGKEPLPSKTFEILSICLGQLSGMSSAKDIEALIQTHVSSGKTILNK